MRQKLKIAFMGPSNSVHLFRWMDWFVKKGHEVFLISDVHSNMPHIEQYILNDNNSGSGNRIERYFKLEFNDHRLRAIVSFLKIDIIKKILGLREMIRKINPDILHLHTMFYPAYLGVFSGFRPLVVTPWNGDIVWRYQWSFMRKYAVKKGLFNANLITVDSEELRAKVNKYGNYKNKTGYISFGVDTSIFNPHAGSSRIRKKLNIGENAPIIISPRSNEKFYNIDIIVSAVPLVLKKHPNAVFVFCGHSNSQDAVLVDLAGRLGVAGSVRFLGNISDRSELAGCYAEADVSVSIPSGDTIAISLLEAMACAAAPVISDLPSPRECVKDGVNGSIVPLRDVSATAMAVIRLLDDKELRERYVRHNLNLIKEYFEWDKNMSKAEDLYYGLLSNKVLR